MRTRFIFLISTITPLSILFYSHHMQELHHQSELTVHSRFKPSRVTFAHLHSFVPCRCLMLEISHVYHVQIVKTAQYSPTSVNVFVLHVLLVRNPTISKPDACLVFLVPTARGEMTVRNVHPVATVRILDLRVVPCVLLGLNQPMTKRNAFSVQPGHMDLNLEAINAFHVQREVTVPIAVLQAVFFVHLEHSNHCLENSYV